MPPQGVFDVQTGASIIRPKGEPTGLIVVRNKGILRKSKGPKTIIQMDVNQQSGGRLDIGKGREIDVQGSGTPVSLDTGTTDLDGGSATVRGTVQQTEGTLNIGTGQLSVTNQYNQMAGDVTLRGGSLQAGGGYSLSQGARLFGTGTITADSLNAGQFYPGGLQGTGQLTVSGSYLQTPTSSLNIGIGGTVGTQYDQLNITGTANLAGTLNISLANGFTPSLGQSFQILNYGSSTGNFQSISGLQFAPGLRFDVQYNPTNITLTVVANSTTPAPAVSSLSANSGTTAGGTAVTITGTNFTGVTGVSFGGTPASNYTVNSSTSITAVAPPAAATGPVDVTVTTAYGTSPTSSSDQFTYSAAPAPTVTAVSPSIGGTIGGTQVVLTGTNFLGATAVNFGSTPAPYFFINSANQLTAYAPAASPGTVDLTVTTAGGTSAASSADHYTYPGTPSVTGLSTSAGSSGGGNQITISGSDLSGATAVSFGGYSSPSFSVTSDTSLTAIVPAQAAGTVDVTVTTGSGTSAPVSADRYTYAAAPAPSVTSLGTSSGTTAGGTSVIVNGSHFTGATAVSFGTVPASSFAVNTDGQLTAVAPPQAAGSVDVTVTTPIGTSAVSFSDRFTYSNAAAPTVTGLSSTSGGTGGGNALTVTGSGFTGATSVTFGTVPATGFIVLSDGTLSVIAPPQAAGTVDVTVTTYSGTSATSSADHYTYTAASAPTVSALTPSSGSTTGGATVVLTGSNFTGASAVNFGSVAATNFWVISDNAIQATAPAGSVGSVDVTVTTPSGTSATGASDRYTCTAAPLPIVTGLSTSSGGSGGATPVTLTGSGFTGASEVDFGSVPVYAFVVNSDTQLTVLTPPQPAGTVDVRVVTPAGTSAPTSADRFSYTAAAPSVTALGTSSGSTAGGTSVTLTGSGFTGATSVAFGTVPASSFVVNSDTSLTAVAPAQAASIVPITVTTASGTSASTTASQFTYSAAPAPSLTMLGTSSGSTAGGTPVTINGSYFTGASAVTFGGVPATRYVVQSDSVISAVAPPHASGSVTVSVSTPSGTANLLSGFTYNNAFTPMVSGLSSTSDSTPGGSTVVLTGSGFTGATGVQFGSVQATSFVVNSDSSITAVSPPEAAGTVDVTVSTYAGTSATNANDQFTYDNVTVPAPAVTAVSPSTGSTAGGQVVRITGTNFSGATAVAFGGSAASSFTINSDSSLTAVAPAGSAGVVDVTVTTNNGTSATSGSDQFTYLGTPAPTVTGLSPNTGTTAGGASVTITGTNFTGATGVTFGGVPAASYTVNSSTSITATAPPEAAGTVDVTVTTPSGTSATGSADQFTVTNAAAPVVSNLGTTTGSTAGGTSVTITGSGFTGATGVFFGGVPTASYSINSDSSITAVAPPQYAGTVDVTVSTFSGTSATVPNDQFTFTAAPAPVVTNLGTTTGTTAGGTSVTLTGTNFTGATGVTFGDVPAASYTVNSATSITAVSPPQATGTVDVVVTTYTGTSQTSSADQFSYTAAAVPSVTGLGTSTGSTGGGTSVTLSGSGFTGATGVTFGGVAAGFTVNSDTSITAISPPQAAGMVDVTVTTYAGTSATGSADQFSYSAAPAPVVSAVTSSSGSTAGGTLVTVLGSGFTGASAVNFGSTPAADFTVLSDTALLATAPAGTTGATDITVTTPSGTSATGSNDQFTYSAATVPVINSMSPASGLTAGGAVVTLSGSGFTSATGVNFGSVPASAFWINSDNSLTAVAPSQTAGSVDVTVTAPGAVSALTSADRFTYQMSLPPAVTNLDTASGSTAGGTAVTITGNHFTGATGVNFGGVPASYTVLSDSSINAVSPSGAAGTVDVTVTTATGTSAALSADQFTYSNAAVAVVTPEPDQRYDGRRSDRQHRWERLHGSNGGHLRQRGGQLHRAERRLDHRHGAGPGGGHGGPHRHDAQRHLGHGIGR
jgi:hypothetical protein